MNNKNYSITDRRIELKDVFTTDDLTLIEKSINLSRFSFYKPYPSRKVNSVYFDDLRFSALEDSIEGNSLRTKKRLRWYGNSLTENNAVLEFKKKLGVHSWKELYRNNYCINPIAHKWSEFIVTKSNDNKFQLKKISETPVSIVTYNRQYYSSFDRKIRVTIDRNIQTYKQTNLLRPNFSFHRKHSSKIILEIKVSVENFGLIREVFRDIPFNPQRFSKYCESLITT
ncbi:VTC domain-containing protein [Opitutales bacterium]|nr:VTC domain-containing protein [Opitutales bacterium]